MSNKKRLPVNSIGIKLREAREKTGLSEEELSWKINHKNIDKKQIKKWEKGQEFPNLDEMYELAKVMDINPNELLQMRNQIQDESQTEPNWAFRHLFGRFFKLGKPGLKIIFEIVLGVCVLFLVHSFVDLTDKMGGDQAEEFTNQLIYDEIQEFAYQNNIGLEASKMRHKNTVSNETQNEVQDNAVANETANEVQDNTVTNETRNEVQANTVNND